MSSNWVSPALTSGLGNRLFQTAAAAAAAQRWGRQLVFYMPAASECPHGNLATIFRMFPGTPVLEREVATTRLEEPPRRFYEYIPLGPAPDGPVVIAGFRQSPAYFSGVRMIPQWTEALGGPAVQRFIERAAGLYREDERRRTVALHVRLGDYRKLAHHQQDLAYYYARALERVQPGQRLHLFSDEPDLCAASFGEVCRRRGIELTVAKVRADVESMYEMSLCLGGIICANSTFSWWAAYFAQECGVAWVTMPDTWGAGMPEPVDLFPEWATVIPVSAPSPA